MKEITREGRTKSALSCIVVLDVEQGLVVVVAVVVVHGCGKREGDGRIGGYSSSLADASLKAN